MPRKDATEVNQKTLASFLEMDDSGGETLVVDRSTLERWMTCPWQAAATSKGQADHVGILAEIGEGVHQAKSEAITEYIESEGAMNAEDLRRSLMTHLLSSRPDVQPRVIEAAKATCWSWSRYVAGIHPGCLIAFDGGDRLKHPDDPERTRSGQLSWDISMGLDTVRVTSELDLLHSTESPEVLNEVDYKTGWKQWTYADVFKQFQFCVHAWLVFHNFESVNYLNARVWNTRTRQLTAEVTFKRADLEEYDARVQAAVGIYWQHRLDENPPAWPALEKCDLCPVAHRCPSGVQPVDVEQVAAEQLLSRFVAVSAAQDAIKKKLWAEVERTGKDVVSEDGLAFGWERPSAARKPTNPIYQTKEE